VRAALKREVDNARARGVDVSPASATLCYVLADLIDECERTGANPYLIPQLTGRLLEERRAANLLPDKAAGDDTWDALDEGFRQFWSSVGQTPAT
jgi:hypothetical protein